MARACLALSLAWLAAGQGDWGCAPRPNACDGHRERLNHKASVRMAQSLAAPFMVDWNGDGLLDLLVGEHDGTVRYYEKSKTDGLLYPKLGKENSFSVIKPIAYNETKGHGAAAPLLVDWDGDGHLELLVAAGGRIRYFKIKEGEFEEQLGKKSPFKDIHIGYVAPRFSAADWDADGDVDLIVPRGRSLAYYEQVNGTLVERTGDLNPFDHVKGEFIDNARGWDGTYGAPWAVDWDGDGDMDLIFGQVDGTVLYFERLNNAHLAQRMGTANPFSRIQQGHFAAVQAIDYNGDGLIDVLTGNQDGEVALFARERDVHLQERKGIANPFQDIGALPSAVPSALLVDEEMSVYFMFQETNRGHVMLFKRLEDGRFQNLTSDRPPSVAMDAVWLQAGQAQYLDWNGDGLEDMLVIYHNGTIIYQENRDGALVELQGPENPFDGLSFGSAFSDTNVSGFLPLDMNADGRKELLVAEWGLKPLRFFETGWCEISDPCNARGVCLKVTGQCSCMLGYSGSDCTHCSGGFFTERSAKPSEFPGFACRACPGKLSGNGTCSSRGTCQDDDAAHKLAKETEGLSQLQLAFLRGNGSCSCSENFAGENCAQGECPAGMVYEDAAIIAHCEKCSPGFFKSEPGNLLPCRMCQSNHYAPSYGAAKCTECIGSLFIFSVNKDHTTCTMDVSASLPVLVGILCWTLVFYFAPMVFGLPVIVSDISLGPHLPSEQRKEEGRSSSFLRSWFNTPPVDESENLQCVKVKSHGTHNLLRGQRATIFFRGTGDPRLDTKRFDYKVEGVTHHELLLLHLDGTPVTSNHDSSTGTLQVKHQHAMLRMGMLGLPFIIWTLLPIAGYAGLVAYLNSSDKKFMPSTSSLHVAIGCLISILLHSFRYRNLARTRLKKDILHFIKRLKGKNPNPTRCSRGPTRAITAGQLKEFDHFFHGYHGSNRTMYYVCHNIILQLTHPFKLSYAELAGPTTVSWFVSHYWGTSFRHFVDTVSKHSEEVPPAGRRPSQQSYWICSFSNNQWAVEEEVGKNWDESSFYLAMRSHACKGTVMVFDEDALPLNRSWCLFELLQTHHFKQTRDSFEGLLLCSANGVMNRGNGSFDLAIKVSHKLANLDLREAKASKESDKLMIEELVRRQAGFKNVRSFLTSAVEEVLYATREKFQDKMTELRTSLELTQSDSPTNMLRYQVPDRECQETVELSPEVRPALLGSLRKAYTTSLKSLEWVLKRSGSANSSDPRTPVQDDLEAAIKEEEEDEDDACDEEGITGVLPKTAPKKEKEDGITGVLPQTAPHKETEVAITGVLPKIAPKKEKEAEEDAVPKLTLKDL
ncbi:unnamed protein product [Effrenium voratum]|uniref:EGF-like domain-containing protein n=1 Tax=Effrenium voratum TaxID=2562239 RepID=A0AA36ID33_9DINO|nr:unnamed protein product [Effrenium voratum]